MTPPRSKARGLANRPARQRGLAMVEMAIVIPVLLLMMFAAAELGRAFYQHNALTKAVRDGARYLASNAIRGTTGVIDITGANSTVTKNIVVYGDPTGSGSPVVEGLGVGDIQISVPDTTHVQVTATYAYQPMWGGTLPTFGLGGAIDTTFTFTAGNTMRALE